MEYDNSFSNTKYCLAQMMHEVLETPKGLKLKHTRTMKELWYILFNTYYTVINHLMQHSVHYMQYIFYFPVIFGIWGII